jgi:hypothetical protein
MLDTLATAFASGIALMGYLTYTPFNIEIY